MSAANQRGFTLVELMISLVIFSLAVAGVLSVAVSMNQGFREQRQAIGAEDNARGAMDFISDAVRSASPAITQTGIIQDDITCGCFAPDTTGTCSASKWLGASGVVVTNSTTAPDKLRVVFASGGVVTSLRDATYVTGGTSMTLTDVSQISAGDYLMITNSNLISSGNANGDIVQVTAVAVTGPGNQGTVTLAASAGCPIATTYNQLSLVIRVVHAMFSIDQTNTYGFGTNVLVMTTEPDVNGVGTTEPLADHVEDMQVALGLDTTASGGVNYWEYASGFGATTGTLRAARITFIAQTSQTLQGGTSAFLRPAAEDHPASSTGDNYRRRVLSSTIEIRNLKGSP